MSNPCEQCPKFRCCDAPCPVVETYASQDHVPESELPVSQIGNDLTMRDDCGTPYSLYDYVRPISPPYELSRKDQELLIKRVGTERHLHQYDTQPDEEGNWPASSGVWENSATCDLDRQIIRLYYFRRMLQKDIASTLFCSKTKVKDIINRNHYLVVRFRRENNMGKWKPNKHAKVGSK